MKVISFDVGIKNMAYCIFFVSSEKVCVQDWGILNLMDEIVANPVCSCENKKKKKNEVAKLCGHKSKYQKGDLYMCEKHAKQMCEIHSWTLPVKMSVINKMSRDALIELGTTYGVFSDVDGAPKTKKGCLQSIQIYLSENMLEKCVETRMAAGDLDLITIGRNMKDLLHKMENVQDITHIIIENQISTIATRMKTIQGMLAQYYIMHIPDAIIEFVSSSNKLKHLITMSVQEGRQERRDYKQNKKDSILFCTKFLDANPGFGEWSPMLTTPKKDDLADAFLQGIWYLKREKLITYAENLKTYSVYIS